MLWSTDTTLAHGVSLAAKYSTSKTTLHKKRELRLY